MNPTGAPTPPDPEAVTPDIPDTAFGFADDTPRPPKPVAAPAILPPVTAPAKPTPVPIAPAPAPAPVVTAPAPQAPIRPPAAPAPMPADILPPKQVPAVPTLAPPTPVATTPAPASPPPSYNPTVAQPVRAAAVPASTASYSPTSEAHVPEAISERIAETPLQNSTDVTKQIEHGTSSSRLKSLVSFLIFTAAIFVAAFLINQFVFQSYYVEGTSMTPTLQNNDRLIISKVERTIAAISGHPYIPQRGQIVVLDSSIVGLNGQKEQLIKRVIGLPGDHIHIDNGVVTITNSEHPTGYDVTQALGLTNLQPTYTDSPIDLTVPNGQVYVMGDNREQGGSYDSRAFGPIDGDKIQGRLWARILPIDHAQLF